jgi:hypothetical protein
MTNIVAQYDQKSIRAINQSFIQKLQEFVGVKDFGAVGNNVTNETTPDIYFYFGNSTVYYI